MSLTINDADVREVLLADGWHAVDKGTYWAGIFDPERVQFDTPQTWFHFRSEGWGYSGPLATVLLLKHACSSKPAVSPQTIHGHCPTIHGRTKPTLTWRAWSHMRDHAKRFRLAVDTKWDSFDGFFEDMGARPTGHRLAKPSTGTISKKTCSWIRRGQLPPP